METPMILTLLIAVVLACATLIVVSLIVTRRPVEAVSPEHRVIEHAMAHMESMHNAALDLAVEQGKKIMAFTEGGLQLTKIEQELASARAIIAMHDQKPQAVTIAEDATDGTLGQRWKDSLAGSM